MKTMTENNFNLVAVETQQDAEPVKKEPTTREEILTPGSFYSDTDKQESYYILNSLPNVRFTTRIPTPRQLLQAKGWLQNTLTNDPDSATNEFLIIKLITLCSSFEDLNAVDKTEKNISITFDTIISAFNFDTMVTDIKMFFQCFNDLGVLPLLESVLK
jgi:hypothetical protein